MDNSDGLWGGNEGVLEDSDGDVLESDCARASSPRYGAVAERLAVANVMVVAAGVENGGSCGNGSSGGAKVRRCR